MNTVLRVALAAFACAAVAHATEPARLPEYVVPGQRVGSLEIAVPLDELRTPAPNLAPALLSLPGVYGQARATDSLEPNIRGMGFDRITTTLNGLPLVNATPERTHAPIVALGGAAVSRVSVVKALPSVTLGPATSGGRITVTSEPELPPPHNAYGWLKTTHNEGRRGYSVQGSGHARANLLHAGASVFSNDLGNYRAGDGTLVAAEFRDVGGSASLGWTDDRHNLRAEIVFRRLFLQRMTSLPMDGKNTESAVFTVNDRWTPASQPAARFEWRAGYAVTDPYITSEDRVSPQRTFAHSKSRSVGGGLSAVFRLDEADLLHVGADYARQTRNAIRTTPGGRDYIWPDAMYRDVGIFAEWSRRLQTRSRVRLGGRLDDVTSEARSADQRALGRPIREQYVTYNGPEAAKTNRHDLAGAANLLLEWEGPSSLTGFLGAGVSIQPAPVTERYRAFLNALGGDGRGGAALEVGNPGLKSERKLAIEAGGAWRAKRVELESTVFAYRIANYIHRVSVGRTQPPLAPMEVFGYRNIDASFVGAEIAATWKPSPAWRIPMTFAVAQAENADTGRKLPEMPPWEASAAVRHDAALGGRVFAMESGVRLVGGKRNPAPLENPLFADTGGFAVWHVRVASPLGQHMRVEAGIENAFDRVYSEYLSVPAAPNGVAAGNLRPGQRVPAPGRSGWVSVTLSW